MSCVDIDLARRLARESEHVRHARERVLCSRDVSDETIEALCKESMERATFILALAEELDNARRDVVLLTAERNQADAELRAVFDKLRSIAGPIIGA